MRSYNQVMLSFMTYQRRFCTETGTQKTRRWIESITFSLRLTHKLLLMKFYLLIWNEKNNNGDIFRDETREKSAVWKWIFPVFFLPEPAQSHNKLKSNIDKLFSLCNEKRNVYNIVFVRLFLDMFVTEYRVHFVCVSIRYYRRYQYARLFSYSPPVRCFASTRYTQFVCRFVDAQTTMLSGAASVYVHVSV